MTKVTVRLIKPLNGREIGSEVEYDRQHIKRLVALGAVEVVKAKAPAKAKAAKKAKADPVPLNKMEPAPMNKAADPATSPPAGGAAPAEGDQQG